MNSKGTADGIRMLHEKAVLSQCIFRINPGLNKLTKDKTSAILFYSHLFTVHVSACALITWYTIDY